jgi:hypothetical protein
MRSTLDFLIGLGLSMGDALCIEDAFDAYDVSIEVPAINQKQATGIAEVVREELESRIGLGEVENLFQGLKESNLILVEGADNLATRSHASDLIEKELDKQDQMWGTTNERTDVSKGQLLFAGYAQFIATVSKEAGVQSAFDSIPDSYPGDWSGFRDYGSTVANLVVVVSFLTNEIRRRLRAGESDYRKPRDKTTQPYIKDQPKEM